MILFLGFYEKFLHKQKQLMSLDFIFDFIHAEWIGRIGVYLNEIHLLLKGYVHFCFLPRKPNSIQFHLILSMVAYYHLSQHERR